MQTLNSSMKWQRMAVGAGAMVGEVEIAIGQIGSRGPAALITAGIHGDEGPWGALAIRKFLEETPLSDLRGTIRVIPVSNPLAAEADARNAPLDTLDLNRVFPGDAKGSHTERLAALIVAHGLADAEIVIDLHGGGSWCVNSFVFQFGGSEALATAFDAPFIVNGPDRNVTLTGYARSKGARVTAVEMGGRSQFEETWARRIASGLRRALAATGVLSSAPDANFKPAIPVGPSTVLRPSRGGVFIPYLRAEHIGTIVPKDTPLGALVDPVTYNVVETFNAPFDQTALMLLRPAIARLEGGAMTYVVSSPL